MGKKQKVPDKFYTFVIYFLPSSKLGKSMGIKYLREDQKLV